MDKNLRSALAIAISLALTACGSDNSKPPPPVDTIIVPIAQPPVDKVTQKQPGAITILILDGVTGEPPIDDNGDAISINFKLLGNDLDSLVSADGSALTETEFSNSSITNAIAVGSIGTEETISVNIVADASGYFPNNVVAEVSESQNEPVVTITLTPKKLPENLNVGVTAQAQSINALASEGVEVSFAETGQITTDDNSPLVVELDLAKDGAADNAVGGVEISIASGTFLLGENDEPLTSAPEVAVAYYSNEASDSGDKPAESAIDYFPGGLSVAVQPESETEDAQEGDFITGGFVAIEITDEAGNKVKNFGKDAQGNDNFIEVKMQIDTNSNNPCPMVFSGDLENDSVKAFVENSENATETAFFSNGVCESKTGNNTDVTARTIKENDIVPVWSYEETNGSWKFESYGVAVKNTTNDKIFDVVVNVNHLSFWNLDYFLKGTQRCASRVNFTIEDRVGNPNAVSASLLLEAQGGGARFLRKPYEWGGADKAIFNRPPAYPVTVQFLNANGDNILLGMKGNTTPGQSQILPVDDLCVLDGQTLVLDVEAPAVHDQTINTRLVCDETGAAPGTRFPAPIATSTYVYLFKDTYSFYYTDNNGEATAEKLETGATYTASAYDFANNVYINSTFTATSAGDVINIDIPTTCDVIDTEVPITGTTGTGGG
jgi:hypothetical protein